MSESAAKPAGVGSTLATAGVLVVSLTLMACAVLMTRVELFRSGHGVLHLRVQDLTFLLPPIAAVLFAHGASWWRRGLRVRAAFALAAFPAWAILLRATDTVIGNDVWIFTVLAQSQGIQPFGVAQ